MTHDTAAFESSGWRVHSWNHGGQAVTVLQREPFRLEWFATRLVTFVYLIDRTPESYESVLADYDALRKFAGDHKRTLLPIGFQCGYALLPIYVGRSFPQALLDAVRTTYRKRWCVIHAPSLFDSETGRLHTLEATSFWGIAYRRYVADTLADVAAGLAAEQRRA